jgi:uridine kinase
MNFSFYDSLAEKFRSGDVVLIGGLSKSGKTTLSEHLRKACLRKNLTSLTLSIDRWLNDLDSRSPGVMGRYDLTEIRKVLSLRSSSIINEIFLELPEYDKYTQKKSFNGQSVLIYPKDVLIVEGTIALTLAGSIERLHCFYIEINEALRRQRVIDEYLSRGRNITEAEQIYAERELDETPVIKLSSAMAVHLNLSSINLD